MIQETVSTTPIRDRDESDYSHQYRLNKNLRSLEKTEMSKHLSQIPFQYELTVNTNLTCYLEFLSKKVEELDTELNFTFLKHKHNKPKYRQKKVFLVVLPEKCFDSDESQKQTTHFHSLIYLPQNLPFPYSLVEPTDNYIYDESKNQIIDKMLEDVFREVRIKSVVRKVFPSCSSDQSIELSRLKSEKHRYNYFKYPYKHNQYFDDDRYLLSHSTYLPSEINQC